MVGVWSPEWRWGRGSTEGLPRRRRPFFSRECVRFLIQRTSCSAKNPPAAIASFGFRCFSQAARSLAPVGEEGWTAAGALAHLRRPGLWKRFRSSSQGPGSVRNSETTRLLPRCGLAGRIHFLLLAITLLIIHLLLRQRSWRLLQRGSFFLSNEGALVLSRS